MTRLAGAVLLAISIVLAPVVATGDASAAMLPTALVLSVRDVPTGSYQLTLLRCDPPGGTHPRAGEACADLALAGGDFDRLPGDPETHICTLEYRPVIASARGVWRSRGVRWSHTFGDSCALRAGTGPVFDF